MDVKTRRKELKKLIENVVSLSNKKPPKFIFLELLFLYRVNCNH